MLVNTNRWAFLKTGHPVSILVYIKLKKEILKYEIVFRHLSKYTTIKIYEHGV